MQADDNEATVATAIDRYNQACEPLLDHFREAGLLSSIDTGALLSSTHQRINLASCTVLTDQMEASSRPQRIINSAVTVSALSQA